MYAVTGDQQFGTVDLTTGAFHQIGPDTPESSGCVSAGVEWIAPQPFCLRQSGYFCCWPYCPLRAIGQVVTLTSRTATRSSSAIMTDDRRDIGAAKVPEPVSGVVLSIGIAASLFRGREDARSVSQVTAPFSVIN